MGYLRSILSLVALCCLDIMVANDLPIKMLGGQESIVIDFKTVNGYIIVPIQINETLEIDCIFDTGAEHSLLFNTIYTDILGLEYSDTIQLYGSDFMRYQEALITRQSWLKVGNGVSIKHDLLITQEAYYNFEELIGYRVEGILGMSYFKNLGIKIDYIKKKLHIFDAKGIDKFAKPDYHKQDMDVVSHKPYIKTSSKGSQVTYLLDSGANLSLLEYIDSTQQIQSKYIEGILGRGLGGEIVGYAGLSKSIPIFDQRFESIVVNYQVKQAMQDSVLGNVGFQRDGLVGNEVLAQFYIILDFLNREIYTKPNRHFSSKAKYNKSGIEVVSFGPNLNQYFIRSVVMTSPAELADIREGDIILSINRIPSSLYNLQAFKSLFSRKKDKKIRLKIRRQGKEIFKEFYLKDYLNDADYK